MLIFSVYDCLVKTDDCQIHGRKIALVHRNPAASPPDRLGSCFFEFPISPRLSKRTANEQGCFESDRVRGLHSYGSIVIRRIKEINERFFNGFGIAPGVGDNTFGMTPVLSAITGVPK